MVTGIEIEKRADAGFSAASSRAGSLRLHLLAGCRALLAPAPLAGEEFAILLGEPRLRNATAYWLSSSCGRFYHDFLLEIQDDSRVAVFARSLAENFGDRFEPLIVLSNLIDETNGALLPSQGMRAALDVLLEIRQEQPNLGLVLHAIALPEEIDADGSWVGSGELLASQARARLEGLRTTLAAAGQDPSRIEISVTETAHTDAGFGQLVRNAIASQIAKRLEPRLATEGLDTDPLRLEATIAQILTGWSAAGMQPARSLGAPQLDTLSERIFSALSFTPTEVIADA